MSVRPFIVRRDGVILDRGTETPLGVVRLERSVGWVARSPWGVFYAGTRWYAARQVWAAWKLSVTMKEEE